MRALFLALLAFVLVACGATEAQQDEPGAGQQWAPCGFDKPECGGGLECFGVCTFECGEKYFQQPDGSYAYGLDVASVDRCVALGGSCKAYAPGVDINFCKAGAP